MTFTKLEKIELLHHHILMNVKSVLSRRVNRKNLKVKNVIWEYPDW